MELFVRPGWMGRVTLVMRTARPELDPITRSTALSTVSTMLFMYLGRMARVAPAMRTARLGPGSIRRYTVEFVYYHRDPVAPVLRTVTFLRVLLRTLPGTRLLSPAGAVGPGDIAMPPVRLSVHLSVCPSVRPSVRPSRLVFAL